MIEVENLTKKYGSFSAVDDLSFNVNKGEILGFLGPNGAGKSTTMKMLSCFTTPTSGTARIGGFDIINDSLAVRELVGYLPESAPSYKDMTVLEFLTFIAEIRGFEKKENKEKVENIVETTFLDKVLYQTINTLSKGYRQRVGFAQALIHDPPVLILDEPTDGLDPNQKYEVRTLIKKMAAEKAIILSTHILEEMEAVCTRALIINNGKIVADGTPDELLSRSERYNAVNLTFDQKPDATVLSELGQVADVKQIEDIINSDTLEKFQYRIIPENGQLILPVISKFINDKKILVNEIYSEKGQMDKVFRNLTLGD
ncbi:MAG: ATP-binding cassette domain-containing protein [Deltaproteobacteria bacterium]|jgi:ABC-2 type transport system ATP-binding protein|nr:ATP-binding cassette domain-containing protein [Deltaproteobacteria bacterium]MBT4528011.1 ATP-binding cassette domain-containing protein [Deltaproteobacteria bacterium]